MNITLPPELIQWVDQEITNGHGASADEVVEKLIRQEQMRRWHDSVEEKLVEGLESGDPVEANTQFWTDLRTRARQTAASNRQR